MNTQVFDSLGIDSTAENMAEPKSSTNPVQSSDIGFCTCGSASSCCAAWAVVVRFFCWGRFFNIVSEDELKARLAGDEKATIIKALGDGIEGQSDGGRMPQAQRAWVIEQVRLADEGKPSAFPADRGSTIIIACSEGSSAEVTRVTLEEFGYTTACNAGPWRRLDKAIKETTQAQ